ncbi:MAG TPA: hypothetical protein VJ787_11375, partial [Thermoleophilia bacterium]|nr:hypothetical protein [Thermoleophilia bacterium]
RLRRRGDQPASLGSSGLSGAAGLALLVLGVRLFWRSRRRDGDRYLRRALLVVGGLLLIYYVVLP